MDFSWHAKKKKKSTATVVGIIVPVLNHKELKNYTSKHKKKKKIRSNYVHQHWSIGKDNKCQYQKARIIIELNTF